MITEDEVVAAYRNYLRLKVRQLQVDPETAAHFEERHDAMERHYTLRLQHRPMLHRLTSTSRKEHNETPHRRTRLLHIHHTGPT